MAFVWVQQETLLTDIIKTWIKFFKDTWDFQGINFRVTTPDTDKDLVLPLIVLKRVSNDTWSISRNGWYYWINWGDATTETTLYWHTYSSLMQFDIMTTTITEANRIEWLLYKSLSPSSFWSRTQIPLRTFTGVDSNWSPTDLQMKFYFDRDISWAMIPSFDPNLHQCSISVDFLVDYLSEVSNPKVVETVFNTDLDTL